jgi:hypothetical protein
MRSNEMMALLMKKVEDLQADLIRTIKENSGSLTDEEIVKKSQELDEYIAQYIADHHSRMKMDEEGSDKPPT